MDKLLKQTKKRFFAIIILVVCFVVGLSWGILQLYTYQEIGSPASTKELHHTATHNDAFSAYLEEQKAYEAHFITLASSIKQQEQDRVTKALAITAAIAVTSGMFVAFIVSRKLIEPVAEAYQSQERFMQDAAHELRNPLAAMAIALQEAESKQQQSRLITTFRRQTNRLIRINEDLLYLERQPTTTARPVPLHDLLEEVVEELQPLATKKKQRITLQNESPIIKSMISEDYVRLTKNIIENAIKYSPNNKPIKITQTVNKNTITITVVDQGIGIPRSEKTSIGKRFFRASNTGSIDGTGLGIAIATKILRYYGGSIEITSEVSKGTTVTLKLPT